MKSYIFITDEGITFQPNTESPEPDVDNCQVIGFTKGKNPEEAFGNLIRENDYLLKTNFNELICFELKHSDYYKFAKSFNLNNKRRGYKSNKL
ncbi:MAG: hypothetical protein OEZ20_04900 [candidate division WOR-3 bacterium]|nr:hypothetical protein [candidate division WOR-3 bacterium]MDH5683782.1 hypothetical protein [candidate division WOR-3 bacterium]